MTTDSQQSTSTQTDPVTVANARFWNEPCGTALARSLGITSVDAANLARFDRSYFEMYPYLRGYVDDLGLRDKRVLELGVGYGTLGQHLAARAASYAAVDIAEEPVGLLQQRLALIGKPAEAVVQGSALAIPIPTASVDIVVSIGCLHHTGDLARAVDEVHRVLVPGGTAVVMVYNRDSMRRLINVPLAALKARFGRLGASRTSDEAIRRMYDSNLAGDAAPHTDFVSAGQARRLFGRFARVSVDRRNFDEYQLAGRIRLRRRWFLGWIDRILGLDLYIVATK